MNRHEFFASVYQNNSWGGAVSRSGPGSEGVYAEQKRRITDYVIEQYRVNNMLDIGCGDLNWILPLLKIRDRKWSYLGIDIVADAIKDIKQKHQGRDRIPGARFQVLDAITDYESIDIKTPDLILCFHVLLHLTEVEIAKLLDHWRRTQWKYLLIQRWIGKPVMGKFDRNHDIDIESHPLFSFKQLESWPMVHNEKERAFTLYGRN